MKNLKVLCLFLAPLFVFLSCPAFAYVEKNTAIVRIMNKAAGKTQKLSIPVGGRVNHDGLVLYVRNCKQTDPFEAENFLVFIEIYTKTNDRIFSGWMNRNEPGQNPLQNDMHDVWIEKCE